MLAALSLAVMALIPYVVRTSAVAPTDQIATLSQLRHWHGQGLKTRQYRQGHEFAVQQQAASDPDCSKVSCIALTFDDGPNPATTSQILSTLESNHIPATFFIVGSRVAGNENLLQRMFNDGDEIGNHSWSHPDMTKLSPNDVRQQIDQTQQAIAASGVPAPTLFRPPYGAVNQTVRDAAGPLALVLWNEDPKDWAADSSAQVLSADETKIKPGSVLISHDIYHVTADALQPLITNLQRRNVVFVTVSPLMHDYPLIDGQFYGAYKPKLPI